MISSEQTLRRDLTRAEVIRIVRDECMSINEYADILTRSEARIARITAWALWNEISRRLFIQKGET